MSQMTQSRRRRVVVMDLSSVARQVGARIRAERIAAGLNQRQLAGTRYTAAYISALERGLAKPSVASLYYLADRLGREPADFLRQTPGPRRLGVLHVERMHFSDTQLTFVARGGVELAVPLAWFPALAEASLPELRAYRLREAGRRVSWPTLGVELDVGEFLGEHTSALHSASL